jgi:hypothetical protein
MKTFKNTKFTDLEKQLLRSFLPIQNVEFIPDGMQKINQIMGLIFDNENVFHLPKVLKGVVGSLVKKEVLMSEDMEDRGFNCIYLNGDAFDGNQDLLNEIIELVK